MIIVENLGMVERRYSDRNVKLRQIETNVLYNDAVDVKPCHYTYDESDVSIDLPEPPEQLIDSAEYLLKTDSITILSPDPDPDYLNEHEPEPDYFNSEVQQ